ncbi:unnamed protein product, partial [Discosporangium mesarthrocarpum]
FQELATLGAAAAGVPPVMSASDVFDAGLIIFGKYIDAFSIASVGKSLLIVAASFSMFMMFAAIAALVLLTVIEMYIVLALGVIVLGLSGTQWTWTWAFNYYKYPLIVGAKLFTLKMIVITGTQMINYWAESVDGLDAVMAGSLAGGGLVLFLLAKDIPRTVEGLLAGGFAPGGQSYAGSSLTTSSVIMMTAAVGGLMAAQAKQGGGAISAAAGLAKEQDQAAGAANPAMRTLRFAGNVARNLGVAGVETAGK